MVEKITIPIGPTGHTAAKADIWRDGRWTILYIEDGAGITTLSLDTKTALAIASLLRGCAITAAMSD
jgi:hypothetical protein